MAVCKPQNTLREHQCRCFRDGTTTRCESSFSRRHDRDRHERTHLKGDAREEILHRCPLGSGCPNDYKNLQLGNLRTHIRTVHQDIQDLICLLCRPFVLTGNEEEFTRHQEEQHGIRRRPRAHTIANPTPSTTPPPSSPAASQSNTRDETIMLVPLAALHRGRPNPAHQILPRCSFMIVHAKPQLPAEGPELMPILHEAQEPYSITQCRAIPTLCDFLRDTCGIELTECHGLLSPPTSGSSLSELTMSGSSSPSV